MGIEGADGKLSQWPARIVATDAAHDLAVLQIDAPPETLQPIKVPTHCQAGGCPENCCLRQNVHAFSVVSSPISQRQLSVAPVTQ